jgi:hypothetical protein
VAVSRQVTRTLYAGMLLAWLASLVTFVPVQASIVCTVRVALAISDVTATKIGHNHAIICWATDSRATSQVFYDVVSHHSIADYTYHTDERKAPVTRHNMTLNRLSPSTTYYYRARSAVGGIEAISDEHAFTTPPFPGGWKAWWAKVLLELALPLHLCRLLACPTH